MQRLVTYNNEQLTCAEWGRRYNIPSRTIISRLNSGWPVNEALEHPVRSAVNADAREARENGRLFYESVPCRKCGCTARHTASGQCLKCKVDAR